MQTELKVVLDRVEKPIIKTEGKTLDDLWDKIEAQDKEILRLQGIVVRALQILSRYEEQGAFRVEPTRLEVH